MRRKASFFMETYVVRVYRRNPARPAEIVGIVEWVGTEHTLHFSNVEELNAILTTSDNTTEARRYGKNKRSRKGATQRED